MTRITCAADDCEYCGNGNRCTAKSIALSDHSIMTYWDGRQRFQRCKSYKKSQRAAELERMFQKMVDGKQYGP